MRTWRDRALATLSAKRATPQPTSWVKRATPCVTSDPGNSPLQARALLRDEQGDVRQECDPRVPHITAHRNSPCSMQPISKLPGVPGGKGNAVSETSAPDRRGKRLSGLCKVDGCSDAARTHRIGWRRTQAYHLCGSGRKIRSGDDLSTREAAREGGRASNRGRPAPELRRRGPRPPRPSVGVRAGPASEQRRARGMRSKARGHTGTTSAGLLTSALPDSVSCSSAVFFVACWSPFAPGRFLGGIPATGTNGRCHDTPDSQNMRLSHVVTVRTRAEAGRARRREPM